MLNRILQMARQAAHPRLASLMRNAGILFSGNALNGLIGLVYLAVLTRALSIESFGLYALFGAYVALINRLTSFQTWQGLISFGTQAHAQGDRSLLFNLLCFGWLLDLASGVVGYGLALAGAVIMPHWFGLGEWALQGTAVAATILLFNWTSVPTALLRIYGEFLPQAVFQNITAVVQLICVSFLWWIGEDRLLAYLAITAINNILSQAALFAYAIIRAQQRGLLENRDLYLGALPGRCPGLWRFVLITNADGIVRVLREIDIFIVNAILDVTAAGLYRIARTLTRAMGRLTGPFYQTIYPELAHMVASGEHDGMLRLMRQSAAMLGALTAAAWVGFMLIGEGALALAFGPQYTAAYGVAAWCLGAMVVWGAAQPLAPAMMAWRMTGTALAIHLVTGLAYVALLAVLVRQFGLAGAGMALLLFYLLWAGATLVTVVARLKAGGANPRI